MQQTTPKPFVFVLMPFDEKFSDVYEYGIKAACKDAGAYCERVDEQIFTENILERVYNQIVKADIIVAEMTGRNPNVFYETGYAHALNSRVILLTQGADDIPFDLKHYPHIVYDGKISTLKPELEKRIRWCIENPDRPLSKADLGLQLYLNRRLLMVGIEEELIVRLRSTDNDDPTETVFSFPLYISIHNQGQGVIEPDSYRLGLVSSDPKIRINLEGRTVKLQSVEQPDGKMFKLPAIPSLFPDGWENLQLRGYIDLEFSSLQQTRLLIRLFTELGPRDYRFALKAKNMTDTDPIPD